LNAIALVRCGKSEKLGSNEWWVVGGIYSPNHQRSRWWRLLSHGAPNSPVRHRTLSGAPATSPGRWVLTVGASDSWATWQSGGAPDSHCSLSGAPFGAALTSARSVAHLMFSADDRWREVVVAPLAHRTVRCATGHCPVLHRTVRWIIAERPLEFPKVGSSELESLVHRTLSGGAPDSLVRQTRAHFGWL
jgi:hypothetical protein